MPNRRLPEYYYTVDGTEEIIKYELFKDSEGNAYQNKAIHMGEDDGLEVYEDENVFVTDGDEYFWSLLYLSLALP